MEKNLIKTSTDLADSVFLDLQRYADSTKFFQSASQCNAEKLCKKLKDATLETFPHKSDSPGERLKKLNGLFALEKTSTLIRNNLKSLLPLSFEMCRIALENPHAHKNVFILQAAVLNSIVTPEECLNLEDGSRVAFDIKLMSNDKSNATPLQKRAAEINLIFEKAQAKNEASVYTSPDESKDSAYTSSDESFAGESPETVSSTNSSGNRSPNAPLPETRNTEDLIKSAAEKLTSEQNNCTQYAAAYRTGSVSSTPSSRSRISSIESQSTQGLPRNSGNAAEHLSIPSKNTNTQTSVNNQKNNNSTSKIAASLKIKNSSALQPLRRINSNSLADKAANNAMKIKE